MKKWMQMAEDDNQKRKEQDDLLKRKKIEVKDFLLKQMHSQLSQDTIMTTMNQSVSSQSPQFFNVQSSSTMKKGGKAMNIEELRINKQLLKEISRKKKEKLGHF